MVGLFNAWLVSRRDDSHRKRLFARAYRQRADERWEAGQVRERRRFAHLARRRLSGATCILNEVARENPNFCNPPLPPIQG